MKHIFLPVIALCLHLAAFSQKELNVYRASERITIDGELTENPWAKGEAATGFTQTDPNPGAPASQNTAVQLAYDDYALYVAVICYDTPGEVSQILSLRDDFHANIDNFRITLDTYNDDQNGFIFGVSSMGVQYDAKIYQGTESPELNMAWNSAVSRKDFGWQIEMRIPYAAFRFPKKQVQDWGVNFTRYISRQREESSWNPVRPDFENIVAQCGKLTGIEHIEPPLRLALMPYVSAYANHFPYEDPEIKNWSYRFNGGMDVKLGLNEAFTLDMTLVPDFGQVVFDNQVLNLTPFEIQFNENRQFFTEGMELFNKAGLFYSRRIGIQAPYSVLTTLLEENERLSDVPQASQLYNASKISGRTQQGLGIGIFNAITAPQKAKAINLDDQSVREILVSPLTNYNVLVLDQNLKNNSYVTLTNTNVTRSGSFYDANVTGLDTKLNTAGNRFYLKAWTAVSGKYYTDARSIGHKAGMQLGKQTGKWVYNTGYLEESGTYDPNDLGFLTNNNKRSIYQALGYRIFTPFWKLNQLTMKLNVDYNRLYRPDVYTSTKASWQIFVNTKRFHAAGATISSSLTPSYDYFEPRVWGRYYERPVSLNSSAWISSNYQKKFALDISAFRNVFDREDWTQWGYTISPRWRVSDRIFLIYEWDHSFTSGEQGYAVPFGIPAQTSSAIVFGNRDQAVVTNTVNIRYTFTNLMGFTFRLRHYRSQVAYNYFYDLQEDGKLTRNTLTGLDADGAPAYNTNFNAFTIDFVYRWVFRPGSEINVVWKNSIFTSDKRVTETYFRNLQSTLDNGALNSISIKVLYWLEYQKIQSLFEKKRS